MKNDRVLSLLGLARKSGRLVSGEFAVENALKGGKARLVILAGDASENTVRKFTGMCRFREVPCFAYADKESLGRCTGSGERSSVAVLSEELAGALMAARQCRMPEQG